MSTLATPNTLVAPRIRRADPYSWRWNALATLARRRFALSARTPREIIVPLVNPVMFALVIAPALATIVGSRLGFDYMTYAAVGAAGLLIPLNALFAGVGVIVDRESGGQRDLLAAPVPRSFIVLGNLSVALLTTALQVGVLLVAVGLRGAHFHVSDFGVVWFAGAAVLLAVGMYGVAEILANRVTKQEEYVGILPAVGILPYFFAGSLFPISALPSWLGAIGKVIPLTHALALMRYAFVDPRAGGLHDVWGSGDPNRLAAQSLAVLVVFAIAMTVLSVRLFNRASVR
jgi:ABC-2 type transport system permease protein